MAAKRTKYPKWFVWFRNSKDWLIAKFTMGMLGLIKKLPADKAIDTIEEMGRFWGMLYPRTKQARANLKLAFPEKPDDEIEQILRDMWGNLARTAAEYAFLDQIFDLNEDEPEKGRIEIDGNENFIALRDLDGPAVCFTAHTANWEILPVGAAAHGLNITALFRPPNNKYLAQEVLKARTTAMGHLVPSKAGAAWALAGILNDGGKVGILADQYFHKGDVVEFFGSKTKANPLLSKLANNFDCPIYPARTIRLPNGRFKLCIEDPIDIPRDENGKIDQQKLLQKIHDVMEIWIREYPEQWLWLHKKWRGI